MGQHLDCLVGEVLADVNVLRSFAPSDNGHLCLVRVDTSEQLADIFTKGLHAPAWKACISMILYGGAQAT